MLDLKLIWSAQAECIYQKWDIFDKPIPKDATGFGTFPTRTYMSERPMPKGTYRTCNIFDYSRPKGLMLPGIYSISQHQENLLDLEHFLSAQTKSSCVTWSILMIPDQKTVLGLDYFPSIGVAGLAKILINPYPKQLLYVRIFLMTVEIAGFPNPDKQFSGLKLSIV